MILTRIVAAALLWLIVGGAASADTAADAAPLDAGARFALSTFLLLLGAAGAMTAIAGLALRNAGLAPPRHRAAGLFQVCGAGALAVLLFCAFGANLTFHVEPGGLLGSVWPAPAPEDTAPAADAAAHLVFYASLAAIATAIPAGAVAERARLWPHLLFAAVFAGLVFPIIASWVWGGGYLAATWAFADLAGGAVVHAAGGGGALAGALILGRRGIKPGPQADAGGLPVAALGAALAAAGLALATAGASGPIQSTDDVSALAKVILNAALAGGAALVTALALTQTIYRKIDAAAAFSGVIGALAAMSAAPASPAPWQAALVGAMAAVIVALGAPALERSGLDDPAGAVPAHLFCGAWGVLILPWYEEGTTILGQAAGLFFVTAFAFVMSALIFITLRYTIGIRVGTETEQAGLDQAAIAVNAHRDAGLR